MLVIRSGKGRPKVGFGLAQSRNKPRNGICECQSTRNGLLIDPRWLVGSCGTCGMAAFREAPAVAKSWLYYGSKSKDCPQILPVVRAARARAARARARVRTRTRAPAESRAAGSRAWRGLRGPRPSTPTPARRQGRVLGSRPNRPGRGGHAASEHGGGGGVGILIMTFTHF